MCQGETWAWLRASLALILLLLDIGSRASESPDRECCEPLYPFIPILTTRPPPNLLTTQTLPTPVTSNRPKFVDVTIEQQEIATRPRPGKPPRVSTNFRPNSVSLDSVLFRLGPVTALASLLRSPERFLHKMFLKSLDQFAI